MIDDIIKIMELYLNSLDREYDNDMVMLTEKILSELNSTKSDMLALFSAVPCDISNDVKNKLKMILNFECN